jgi:hypothetical protein
MNVLIDSPGFPSVLLIISKTGSFLFMQKHKLLQLQKVIEEKIGSLKEEVEIGTNVKLNSLYIADRCDEIEFLQWIIRTIQPILNRDHGERQQPGIPKRLESGIIGPDLKK